MSFLTHPWARLLNPKNSAQGPQIPTESGPGWVPKKRIIVVKEVMQGSHTAYVSVFLTFIPYFGQACYGKCPRPRPNHIQCRVSEVTVISHYAAESLFRATLSIFGIRRQLSAALRIIDCMRALGPSFYDLAERS